MQWKIVVRRAAWTIFAAALAAAHPLAAQTTTGSIRGFVRGTDGNPVTDALVEAHDTVLNVTRATRTNRSGFYALVGLRPATYQLDVRRIGFAPAPRTVRVLVGQSLSLDFTLRATAQQLAQITVTAPSAAESHTSEVATNVTRQQIADLPTRDRNFLDLASLAPGVRPAPVNGTKTIAGSALAPENVNVYIDGQSYKNDVLEGGIAGQNSSQGNPFPQNAVQEYRVITQNYKAEYAKAASTIITAITRTGGNTWDASAFTYGIVPGFTASDGLGNPASNYRRLQAGATLGGPLIVDKLHLFASYEGTFKDQPSTVAPGVVPSGVTLPFDPSQYAGTFNQTFHENLGLAKLTWTPNSNNTIDVSGTLRKETDFRGFGNYLSSPQTAQDAAETLDNNVYTALATWQRTSGDWLNEAQLSFQDYTWNPQPQNPDSVGLNYQNIIRIGGKDSRQQFTQKRVSLHDDITYSGAHFAGDHVFKAGVSFDHLDYTVMKQLNYNPVFNYLPDSGNFYQYPATANFGFGNPDLSTTNNEIGAYIQDDWSVTPRLLLNLGLRWDVETNMFNNSYATPQPLRDSLLGPLSSKLYPFVNINDYLTTGSSTRPPFYGAFQPRVGFSYDLTGNQKTVAFGGFGVYYDRDIYNYFLDEKYRRQYSVLTFTFNDSGPTTSCPQCVQWQPQYLSKAGLESIVASGQGPKPEVYLVNNNTRPPKSYQFSGGIRQAFGRVYSLSVAYTGIRGYNGLAFIKGADWGALGPNYTNLLINQSAVQSRSNELQIKLDRTIDQRSRWGGGLAITVGKSEQKGDYFFSLDPRYQQVSDYPWRPADYDQRYTIVANGIVRLPYQILASTIISLGSGQTQVQTDCRIQDKNGNCATNYIFPPKQGFIFPHAFASRDVDLRLQKEFPFVGTQQLGVFFDLFNAFNFTNLGCYNYFIPNTGPQDNANYGKAGCAGEGRRFQVGLNYAFGGSRH